MNINVPPQARDHFWQEPPPGCEEFWSFRFPPPCRVGDKIAFRFDGVVVAEAVCSRIEAPGQSECDGTGRFRSGHKVYWSPESFRDLRIATQCDACGSTSWIEEESGQRWCDDCASPWPEVRRG